MGVGRIGGGIIVEWLRKRRDKRAMERKLGRKVSDHELSSISSWMEEPAAPAPPRLSHVKRNLGIVLGVIVAAVAGSAYFLNLGPFSPRPLEGAFPEQISSFKRMFDPKGFRARTGAKVFSTSYSSPAGIVQYNVDTYPTVEAARGSWHPRAASTTSAMAGTLSFTPARESLDGDVYLTGIRVSLIAGASIVSVEFTPKQRSPPASPSNREANAKVVADFVNQLPYAAFGGDLPTGPIVMSVSPPQEIISLLDEVGRDSAGATKKYQGQTVFFSGRIASIGTDSEGKPLLAFQKPGQPVGLKGTVAAAFAADQQTVVKTLLNGQEVKFSGRVKIGALGAVLIEDCTVD